LGTLGLHSHCCVLRCKEAHRCGKGRWATVDLAEVSLGMRAVLQQLPSSLRVPLLTQWEHAYANTMSACAHLTCTPPSPPLVTATSLAQLASSKSCKFASTGTYGEDIEPDWKRILWKAPLWPTQPAHSFFTEHASGGSPGRCRVSSQLPVLAQRSEQETKACQSWAAMTHRSKFLLVSDSLCVASLPAHGHHWHCDAVAAARGAARQHQGLPLSASVSHTKQPPCTPFSGQVCISWNMLHPNPCLPWAVYDTILCPHPSFLSLGIPASYLTPCPKKAPRQTCAHTGDCRPTKCQDINHLSLPARAYT